MRAAVANERVWAPDIKWAETVINEVASAPGANTTICATQHRPRCFIYAITTCCRWATSSAARNAGSWCSAAIRSAAGRASERDMRRDGIRHVDTRADTAGRELP